MDIWERVHILRLKKSKEIWNKYLGTFLDGMANGNGVIKHMCLDETLHNYLLKVQCLKSRSYL